METIVLKKAVDSDAKDIMAVTKKAFTQYAEAIHKEEGQIAALKETEADIIRDIHNKHVYICRLDGETVGSVRFEVLQNGIAYLSRFAVDPEVQSLGIGGLIMEKVRLECLELGVSAITLYTASRMRSTVSFYLKSGYYIHSITRNKDYIRAFMVNELKPMDELFDYESIVGDR
jgi:predicted N-acetyltransferase YhbS